MKEVEVISVGEEFDDYDIGWLVVKDIIQACQHCHICGSMMIMI